MKTKKVSNGWFISDKALGILGITELEELIKLAREADMVDVLVHSNNVMDIEPKVILEGEWIAYLQRTYQES